MAVPRNFLEVAETVMLVEMANTIETTKSKTPKVLEMFEITLTTPLATMGVRTPLKLKHQPMLSAHITLQI